MTAQPPRSRSVRSAPTAALGADAGLVSGEAVELHVRIARLGSRVLALLIDVVVQVLLALFFSAFLTLAVGALVAGGLIPPPDLAISRGLQTLGAVLILVGYPVACETLNGGRSVGKLAVGLRVIRDNGGPVGFRQALTRALVGVAVEWPGLVLPLLTWVVGVTVMLTDPRGRRLGDLAAGTIVVHDRSPSGTTSPPQTVSGPLASWARTVDFTRLDDDLALDVRQLIGRGATMTDGARLRLARSLWAEVAALTSPPPPPDQSDWAYLSAVLAERHRRTRQRLARSRALSTALWPELAPAVPEPSLVGSTFGDRSEGESAQSVRPAFPNPTPTAYPAPVFGSSPPGTLVPPPSPRRSVPGAVEYERSGDPS